MKISQSFNIQRENLQEAPSWIERLLSPLNLTINAVLQALQSNLVLEDNIVGQIRTVKFITDTNYSINSTFNTVIIPWDFSKKKRPQAVWIGQVVQPSNQPPLTKAVTVPTWAYDGASIRVPFITGLENSSTYEVTFVVL